MTRIPSCLEIYKTMSLHQINTLRIYKFASHNVRNGYCLWNSAGRKIKEPKSSRPRRHITNGWETRGYPKAITRPGRDHDFAQCPLLIFYIWAVTLSWPILTLIVSLSPISAQLFRVFLTRLRLDAKAKRKTNIAAGERRFCSQVDSKKIPRTDFFFFWIRRTKSDRQDGISRSSADYSRAYADTVESGAGW